MPDIILVVEDELALRETLVYGHKKEGHTVKAVSDGDSAKSKTRSHFARLDASRTEWIESLPDSP